MKQESHPVVGKHLPSNKHQENPASNLTIQPKSRLFRFLYKGFKYGTVLTIIVLILLGGISILGDTSTEVEANKRIFDVYRNSEDFPTNVDRINSLFEKQSSKFISNKAINLYLNEKVQDGSQTEKLEQQFNDLSSFTEFLVSQRYEGKNVLHLPLSLNEQKGSNIVPESYSSRLLQMLRKNVQKTLQKNKITQPQSVKELKWSRIKKYIDNGKVNELIQLVKDNIVDSIWQWVNSSPSVIVLTFDNSNIQLSEKSSKIKKSLNKWIKENSENSEIIILSQQPLNTIYDVKEEDHFKSYQVKVNLDSIDEKQLCNLLSQSFNVQEGNCQAIKARFEGLGELEQFVEGNQEHAFTVQEQLIDQNSQASKILQQVCTNGHLKHYFYQNQQNINKVLTKSKKGKKSRLDRELQALIVKWSHLKKSMGLNRLKDIFNTLTTDNNEGNKLSLRDMNELGLVYDFDLNELKWRDEQEKLGYEIKSGRVCKDGRGVEEIEEELKIIREGQQQQREGQQHQHQHEQQHGNEEEHDEEQQQQEQGVHEQQQYEQSFIDRSVEQKGDNGVQQQGQNVDEEQQQQEEALEQQQQQQGQQKQEGQQNQANEDQQLQELEQVQQQQHQQQQQVDVQGQQQQKDQQEQQQADEFIQQIVINPSSQQIAPQVDQQQVIDDDQQAQIVAGQDQEENENQQQQQQLQEGENEQQQQQQVATPQIQQ